MTADVTHALPRVRGPKLLLTAAIAVMLAIGTLTMAGTANAAEAPDLGKAANFAVLAGTAVTCTRSTVTGDVGVWPGTAITQTDNCTIDGTVHAGDGVAKQAYNDFLDAYADLALEPCTGTPLASAYTDTTLTLAPGVYCSAAGVTFTRTTLELDADGDANAVWIFKIGTSGTGALTGTNFNVVMIDGGESCNVTWWTAEAATIKDDEANVLHPFLGTILAGTAITITGANTGTNAGRITFTGDAFAKAAVTMTDTNLVGCEGGKGNGNGGQACNQGVGNGPEDVCDPGNSNQGDPSRSNDELGGEPGDPGRKGGNGK